jgi:hypothetical protein
MRRKNPTKKLHFQYCKRNSKKGFQNNNCLRRLLTQTEGETSSKSNQNFLPCTLILTKESKLQEMRRESGNLSHPQIIYLQPMRGKELM